VRLPVREIVGNLVWATDGSVWAAWRVEPDSYPFMSASAKLGLHAARGPCLWACAPSRCSSACVSP